MAGVAICGAVGAAIDAAGDGVEVAGIGQCVEIVFVPVPAGRQGGVARGFEQRRVGDKVGAQREADVGIVGAAGGLDEATTAKAGAVARVDVAEVCSAFVAALGVCRPPDFGGVAKRSRLVADLRQKGGDARGGVDGVAIARFGNVRGVLCGVRGAAPDGVDEQLREVGGRGHDQNRI